jgi:hypothetical protein
VHGDSDCGGQSVAPAPLAHVPPVLSLQPTFGKLFHPQSGGVQSWGSSCLVWGWGAGYYEPVAVSSCELKGFDESELGIQKTEIPNLKQKLSSETRLKVWKN